jgi:hypothetical protein
MHKLSERFPRLAEAFRMTWLQVLLASAALLLGAFLLLLPVPGWVSAAVHNNALSHVYAAEEADELPSAYTMVVIADENGLTDDLLERAASFWNAEPERTIFLFAYGLTEAERAELADALHVKTERVHLDTTATDVADFVYRLVWVHQRRTVYLVTGDECFIPGIYLANKAGLTVYGLAQDPSEWETVRTKEANLRAFWRDLLGVSYTPDEPETETET